MRTQEFGQPSNGVTVSLYMITCFSKLAESVQLFTTLIDAVSFYNSFDRISTPGWLPDNQDMLQARLRTTGITETYFELGHMNWRMIDVGGQRSERKKWIHCFEDVGCLIFVVALSGYDQCLVEDQNAVGEFFDPTIRTKSLMPNCYSRTKCTRR